MVEQPDERIVLIDAGGGTVDAVTYQVTSSYPLRLAAEAAKPGSMDVHSIFFYRI